MTGPCKVGTHLVMSFSHGSKQQRAKGQVAKPWQRLPLNTQNCAPETSDLGLGASFREIYLILI
jgi:hypothetical protein